MKKTKFPKIRQLLLSLGLAAVAVTAQAFDCNGEEEVTEVSPQLGTCFIPDGEPIENISKAECDEHCTDCWSPTN